MKKVFTSLRYKNRQRHDLVPIGLALATTLTIAMVLATALIYLGFTLWDAGKIEKEKLNIVKVSFTAVAGIGGVVALVVAYRRQRVNERAQKHTEYAEIYGQAVEQLGHEKAAVRLGGLYSLEHLAQDH